MKPGLSKIWPHRKDYHFLPNFGASAFDTQGLPDSFSVFDGQPIPNQNGFDTRFNPPLQPMPYGCTGESGAFACGLEDGKLYNPLYLYKNTPPYQFDVGRDIRDMLKVICNGGLMDVNGVLGKNRLAYFNVYGAGPISDFDAARIALWINQNEKRSVIVGTWWYPEFNATIPNGFAPIPQDYNTNRATLHCWLVTGWHDKEYLEILWWNGCKGYMHKDIYNKLLAQPWTSAFVVTKEPTGRPLPIGWQAWIDHLVYYIHSLFNI